MTMEGVTKRRAAGVAAIAAAAVALAAPGAAGAATVTVTTNVDGSNGACTGSGVCTLRDALEHTSDAVNGTFVSVPPGRYTLNPQFGTITAAPDTHVVVGSDARTVTIDGSALNSVPLVVPNGATTELANLTVANGTGGNGGGIAVDAGGTLELVNSRVTGNEAIRGGGIFSQGEVSILNSTIDHNVAGDGDGGGIFTQLPDPTTDSPISIANTTISDNTSFGGGGISASGTTQILSSTIAGNDGGNGGAAAIEYPADFPAFVANTILAGDTPVCSGTPTQLTTDHDIATDDSCGLSAANGDKASTDPLIGPLANNGGMTDTRALLDGSPALDSGNSLFCPSVDQRSVARPQGHCDIGALQRTAAPPVTPTPTPSPTPIPTPTPSPTPTPVPPPTFNKTFNVEQSRGLVRYKVPGSNKYVTLTEGAQIPKGTLLDTTKGRVTLTSADKKGKTQHAWFYQGIFKLAGQTKGKKPITLLNLAGPKPQCGASKAGRSDATASRKRRRSRHLWGNGKGRFRTKGQFSAATVRGTIWLTKDTCDGTLTKVKRGVVAVDDFARHKTFIVKAGHTHLARPPRKRRP